MYPFQRSARILFFLTILSWAAFATIHIWAPLDQITMAYSLTIIVAVVASISAIVLMWFSNRGLIIRDHASKEALGSSSMMAETLPSEPARDETQAERPREAYEPVGEDEVDSSPQNEEDTSHSGPDTEPEEPMLAQEDNLTEPVATEEISESLTEVTEPTNPPSDAGDPASTK